MPLNCYRVGKVQVKIVIWALLTIKSRRRQINECPSMRTCGWPIERRPKVEITCLKILTRNLLVTRWCTEQGGGAVICATAYISLIYTWSPGSQFSWQVFIYTRYRDAKISLYLWHKAVYNYSLIHRGKLMYFGLEMTIWSFNLQFSLGKRLTQWIII